MFVSKPFKVGRNVEEALSNKDQQPEEKQPSAEQMLAQAQIQLEQQKLELEAQKMQSNAQLEQQRIDIDKANSLFELEKHQDTMEFEDVNRQADRDARRLDAIVKARTEVLNDQIRNANQPTNI
jgi:hypothetical protein